MQQDQIDYKTLYERIQLNSIPEVKEKKTPDSEVCETVGCDNTQYQDKLQQPETKTTDEIVRNTITEEQMLKKAEEILEHLAN